MIKKLSLVGLVVLLGAGAGIATFVPSVQGMIKGLFNSAKGLVKQPNTEIED